MANKKSTARKASPKAKAAAAVAEMEETAGSKSLEWKGLSLSLPDDMPEEIVLDFALARAQPGSTATFDLLLTMIGVEQYIEVRALVKAGEAKVEDVAELVGLVFEQYGTSEGESEASQDS